MNTRILEDIEKERNRQDTKWGANQHHPDVDKEVKLGPSILDANDACIFAGLPTEHTAKTYCESNIEEHNVNWAGILVEEVVEAVSSAANPAAKAHTREELVQVAAVCAAWIEDLDSRTP